MQLISRNGRYALDKVLDGASRQLIICTPYITSKEMTRVIQVLQRKPNFAQLVIRVITDLRLARL